MAFVLFFMMILNIVAIVLIYYCLTDLEKKEKLIFIAVGIAIIYMLTSFVYWISTRNIELKEVAEIGKNFITFTFVPINAIITLPIFAKSYIKYKSGRMKYDQLKNRVLVLFIVFAIILIAECFYFKDIQNGVMALVEKSETQNQQNTQNIIEDTNTIDSNSTENENRVTISNSLENQLDTEY